MNRAELGFCSMLLLFLVEFIFSDSLTSVHSITGSQDAECRAFSIIQEKSLLELVLQIKEADFWHFVSPGKLIDGAGIEDRTLRVTGFEDVTN